MKFSQNQLRHLCALLRLLFSQGRQNFISSILYKTRDFVLKTLPYLEISGIKCAYLNFPPCKLILAKIEFPATFKFSPWWIFPPKNQLILSTARSVLKRHISNSIFPPKWYLNLPCWKVTFLQRELAICDTTHIEEMLPKNDVNEFKFRFLLLVTTQFLCECVCCVPYWKFLCYIVP